jgi:hypothetical protein
MNTNGKITVVILSAYFLVLLGAFLLYPIFENLTYFQLIKEGFLFIVFIGTGYALITNMFHPWSSADIILPLVLFTGIILPLIITYRIKKIFPLIISILFFCGYVFFGFVMFGIRTGEH